MKMQAGFPRSLGGWDARVPGNGDTPAFIVPRDEATSVEMMWTSGKKRPVCRTGLDGGYPRSLAAKAARREEQRIVLPVGDFAGSAARRPAS